MLEKYKIEYPYEKIFIFEQAEFLCAAKNISENDTKFYVTKILRELHSFEFSKIFVHKLMKTKYDKQNSMHETMLIQIWKSLKPNEHLTNRISDQWISLGFQANDPATDFRGSGYLGLINLHRLCQTKLGVELYNIASSAKTEYFFCSAGIFFTMLGFKILT